MSGGSGCPSHVEGLRRALQASTGGPVELIETHISCVLLARDAAYKIKKPLTLPFLDYGTLDARRRCCEEEVRLNRRLAPTLYLGVSRITGPAHRPRLDGGGPVLDWAVRMRRFARGALFSERLADGTLGEGDIDRLAAMLACFHEAAPAAPAASDFGDPSLRRAVALAAADGLAAHGLGLPLRDWLQAQSVALAPLWAARRAGGHVRECHGDLHLSNLLLLDGEIAAFDGIEFNPALRWIDVVDDMAFVAMDLVARWRRDLAYRFLNAWLDATGDHEALPALRFAMVYRALVRAQVATLRDGQAAAAARYVETACEIARDADARLLVTHGLPGSGKTFVTQRLLEQAGAIRVRSDVERKRLFGLRALDDTRGLGAGVYGDTATERTYARLLALAGIALQAGYPSIIDAAFLRRAERARAAALAREMQVPFTILDCRAANAVLHERVLARSRRGGDASEADVAVLERLLAAHEPLNEAERACAIAIDSGQAVDAAALVTAWRSAPA